MEEAASGVKGSIAVKVFGKDLYESEKYAVQIEKILGTVQGIEDLGVIRNIGQPELRIELNEGQFTLPFLFRVYINVKLDIIESGSICSVIRSSGL